MSVGLDAFPFHLHPEVLGVVVALVGGYWYGVVVLGPRHAPSGEPAVTGRQVSWFVSGVALYLAFEWWPLYRLRSAMSCSGHHSNAR